MGGFGFALYGNCFEMYLTNTGPLAWGGLGLRYTEPALKCI